MIKPTIGRVVWYQPNDIDKTCFNNSDQPCAALVTYVHNDTMVNLVVFTPNGVSLGRTSVRLVQEGESPNVDESFCEWMPYQIGQAKKHA